MKKKLYRNVEDKKIAGVCSGLADYFDLDATLIRIIWAAAILLGGVGFWLYIICALIVPAKPTDDYNNVDYN
ncbi:MAG: PspC domain-containing protein [Clostridiales bacterium]|nr:PspC domain-containing protein [Clostridiales bacterium]